MEPMCTDFNSVGCSVIGTLLFIEIDIGNEGKKNIKFLLEIGLSSACMKRMVEEKWGYIRGTEKVL